ncbi:ATP synthase F1 subunit delta [Aquirufa salirivi]|uniref:ATP synthase subunit delta n=1 Tax=Aquirufa salirivi TaxID=3104729 RepID=A0ABW8RUE6_9BACT
MSELIVAHRYAKSLLDLAIEKKVVEDVYQDMVSFQETCQNSKELVLAFKSPIIKHGTKMTILSKLFKDKFHAVSYSIFEIITRKNREKFLPAIAKQFIELYTSYKGIQKADVVTSSTLTEEQRKQVIAIVKEYSGKDVQLHESIDESLIGGFILRVGDKQVDDSIRRKLNDLKVSFAS